MSAAVRQHSSRFSSTDSSTARSTVPATTPSTVPARRDRQSMRAALAPSVEIGASHVEPAPPSTAAKSRTANRPPARGLTESWVADLAHRAARFEVGDPITPGLRLRVAARPGDVKTWVWYAVDAGVRRCIVIGRWPPVSVDAARVRLADLKRVKAEGRLGDHLAPPAATQGALLVRDIAEDYFRTLIKGKVRHPGAVRAVLDNDVIPNLGHLEVAKLTTRILTPSSGARRRARRGGARSEGATGHESGSCVRGWARRPGD